MWSGLEVCGFQIGPDRRSFQKRRFIAVMGKNAVYHARIARNNPKYTGVRNVGEHCARRTPKAVFAECEETRNELRVNLGLRNARNVSIDSSEIRSALCGTEV